MDPRLVLDRDKLDRMRKLGLELAKHLQKFTDRNSSRAIEAATLRCLGVVGDAKSGSLASAVVAKLDERQLRQGAAYWLGAVMVSESCDAAKAAQRIVQHGALEKLPKRLPHSDIRKATKDALGGYQREVSEAAKQRSPWRRNDHRGEAAGVITSIQTGDVSQDMQALRRQCDRHVAGAIVRAPLPMSSESLVGKGRGWFSKYAMLEALKKSSSRIAVHNEKVDPPTHLIWGCQHLSAPELCTEVAHSSVSAIEYDWITMTRVGGVHPKRSLVDQQFIYKLMAKAEIDVAVASDHWFDDIEGYSRSHELLIGQLLIESMGTAAGLKLGSVHVRHQLMLHHDSADVVAGHVAHEVSHAQLLREMFPQAPLRLTLPVGSEYALMAAGVQQLCHFAAVVLDGVTHARGSAKAVDDMIETITAFQRTTADLAQDIQFVPNGKLHRQSSSLLERADKLIAKVQRRDFMKLLEEEQNGLFACSDKNVGVDGVFPKHRYYWNPTDDWLNSSGRRRRRVA